MTSQAHLSADRLEQAHLHTLVGCRARNLYQQIFIKRQFLQTNIPDFFLPDASRHSNRGAGQHNGRHLADERVAVLRLAEGRLCWQQPWVLVGVAVHLCR